MSDAGTPPPDRKGGVPHHAGVDAVTVTDDVDPMRDLGECGDKYDALSLCLAEQGRDWGKCQDAVRAVKECMQAKARQAAGRATAQATGV